MSTGLNPGDQAPPGAEQTAENTCPDCNGTGRLDDGACPTCGGTGTVIEIVGDA
jgi:DnaJ-class molecular chaperone